jgi:hypothetical protein
MNSIDRAKKRIRNAGIAGVCLIVITVLQSLLPIIGFSPATIVGFLMHSHLETSRVDISHLANVPLYFFLNLINVLLVVVLTIGIFKKNELFSILLFSYSIIALIMVLPTSIGLFGLPIIIFLIITVFLFWGIVGTHDYNVLIKRNDH